MFICPQVKTEISVESKHQTLQGLAFPLQPQAQQALQQLRQKTVNYIQLVGARPCPRHTLRVCCTSTLLLRTCMCSLQLTHVLVGTRCPPSLPVPYSSHVRWLHSVPLPCPARLTHRDSCETLSLNPPSTLHTHITPGFTPQP